MIKTHKNILFQFQWMLLLVFLSYTGHLNAQDNYISLDKANNEYTKGNYQNAIGLYEEIIKTGYIAAELYYNLGNAYFKANNVPSAILNYERARRLRPNDEDIDFNIKVANNKIIDKIDIIPELFYIRWWKAMYSLNTTNGWAVLSIISLSSLLLLVGLYLFSSKILIRKLCFAFSFLFFVLTALTLNFAFIQQKNLTSSHEAIIFTPTVSVKSSPDANSVDIFVIHEGTKIEITDNIGEWSEIRIANKSKGWVKKDCYEKI